MGRGRGKGKKQNSNASKEDPGSGEEEKIPVSRRRGRPQKILKDDTEEEEVEKGEEDGKNVNGSISNKDVKMLDAAENGKRKRSAFVKENVDLTEKENNVSPSKSADDSTRSPGFRKSGHRRKSKPQRAAEAVVECR